MSDRIGQKLAREKCKQDAARAFPKGPTRKSLKGRKTRAEAKLVKAVRELCVDRDGRCRVHSYLTEAKSGRILPCEGLSEWAHFSGYKRAHTRGLPPALRHSSAGSLMLCTRHHKQFDAGLLRISALTESGCDGPLEFTC